MLFRPDTPPHAPERSRRAFSLVELVVVVAILAILASVAVPRFANSLLRRRVEAAARRVVSDLELVQRSARIRSAALTVEFDLGVAGYRVAGLTDPDHPQQDYRVSLAEPPYEVDLGKVDLDGDATITYDGYGQPDRGGTIVVRAGGMEVEVTVDAVTGEARIP